MIFARNTSHTKDRLTEAAIKFIMSMIEKEISIPILFFGRRPFWPRQHLFYFKETRRNDKTGMRVADGMTKTGMRVADFALSFFAKKIKIANSAVNTNATTLKII